MSRGSASISTKSNPSGSIDAAIAPAAAEIPVSTTATRTPRPVAALQASGAPIWRRAGWTEMEANGSSPKSGTVEAVPSGASKARSSSTSAIRASARSDSRYASSVVPCGTSTTQ